MNKEVEAVEEETSNKLKKGSDGKYEKAIKDSAVEEADKSPKSIVQTESIKSKSVDSYVPLKSKSVNDITIF